MKDLILISDDEIILPSIIQLILYFLESPAFHELTLSQLALNSFICNVFDCYKSTTTRKTHSMKNYAQRYQQILAKYTPKSCLIIESVFILMSLI